MILFLLITEQDKEKFNYALCNYKKTCRCLSPVQITETLT